ncbi:MAG: prepilin-type N-terminal cleavage/methylation domain-containing protein [bacterium]|nr:prepilin-type N-terminal cleavage/methylation domain-containing protein [bacterium]
MKKNGFTLVELLAVIVILAIILVIAVPKITDTIDNARKGSFESSIKMVAAQAETQKTVADTLEGVTFASGTADSKVTCTSESWTGLNTTDYKTCSYYIDADGIAHVTLEGQGKFAGYTCTGTRTGIEGTCTKATS